MKNIAAAASAVLVVATLGSGAAAAQERTIRKEVVVKAPLEAVWNAWTTSEGIKTFFAPDARVEARPDGPFEIYINPFAVPGLRGADDMRFLAVQPMRMLSFTWNAPPHLPEARAQRTSVVLRFQPVSQAETRVSLSHGGWGDGGQWDQAYDYFDRAWGNVLSNLQKSFVEGPKDWSDWLRQLKAAGEAKK